MPRHTRILSLVALLALCGFAAEAPAKSPKALFGDPEMMMYLHDGSDVTGRITKVTDEAFTVQTAKGAVTVPRKKYQGMVMNVADQKKMADRITTDPNVMIAYGQYSLAAKEKITASLAKSLKTKCTAATLKKDIPLVHVQSDAQGRVKKTILLNASECADVNAALLKDIKAIKLAPLPKDYPFTSHSINYFYAKP